MIFKIIKNAPIPKKSNGRHKRVSIYPFAEMEVGDSFDVPLDVKKKVATIRGKISNAVIVFCKSNVGVKFTTRKMPDGHIRVWRIS